MAGFDYAGQSGTSGALTLIERKIAGVGGMASFDFTGIAATYESIEVVVSGRSDLAATTNQALLCRANNDSGNNYHWQRSGSFGGTNNDASAGTPVSAATIGSITAATAPAGAAATTRLIIPGYARTVFNKSMLSLSGLRYAAGASLQHSFHAEWASTAAINRLTLLPASGNFLEGSVVTLYGISGA